MKYLPNQLLKVYYQFANSPSVFFKASKVKVVVIVHSKQTVNLFHGKLVVDKKRRNGIQTLRFFMELSLQNAKNSVIKIIPQSL
jgi:hypothetical protein